MSIDDISKRMFEDANEKHTGAGRFGEDLSGYSKSAFASALSSARIDGKLKTKIFWFFVILAAISFLVAVSFVGFIVYYSMRANINIAVLELLVSAKKYFITATFIEILAIIAGMVSYLFSNRYEYIFEALRKA